MTICLQDAYLGVGTGSGASAVVMVAVFRCIVCLRIVIDIVVVDREVAAPAFALRGRGG